MTAIHEQSAKIRQFTVDSSRLVTGALVVLGQCNQMMRAFARGGASSPVESIGQLATRVKTLLAGNSERFRQAHECLYSGRQLLDSLLAEESLAHQMADHDGSLVSACQRADRLLASLEDELAKVETHSRTVCELLDRVVSESDYVVASRAFVLLMARMSVRRQDSASQGSSGSRRCPGQQLND